MDLRTRALADARQRLDAALVLGDEDAAFAPLGEVLVWIYALSDKCPGQSPALRGVRHARSRVLNGDAVVVSRSTFVPGRYPGEGVFPRTDVLPRDDGYVWHFADLRPPDPERRPAWERYRDHVAGHELVEVLDAATREAEALAAG